MLVMVVFFIAFRWIHLSTPLIRLFLLVLILLLMPTLNFLPVWFALSLLRRSEERFSRNAETELVCRLLLEKKNCRVQGSWARAVSSPRIRPVTAAPPRRNSVGPGGHRPAVTA